MMTVGWWCEQIKWFCNGTYGGGHHDAVPEIDTALLGLAVAFVAGGLAILLDGQRRRGR